MRCEKVRKYVVEARGPRAQEGQNKDTGLRTQEGQEPGPEHPESQKGKTGTGAEKLDPEQWA